ncbi:molybdenum cofactor cytidylyltransferase [Arenibacter nanhaiticus]|uniref:Molybdenum cofactor cytidylyltransferase n=1 Tax=Arenibacter nanhaiticus TaxID=558155 RepID=A0A1M6FS53_9FLAO|nr:nucleotidyltransferase family protein [Arenibacter nanhaiticus]SHJ00459.1 molybdenum cofactor cytidylyltransferase [Arenibacter nanhaiticus]
MIQERSKIAVLIMAAGESSRMPGIKQLLPWGKTTLLGNAIDSAKNSKGCKVFVVLGAFADEITPKIDGKEVTFLYNKDWKLGLGNSISFAVNHLRDAAFPYEGILLMLADQPLIDECYLDELIEAFKKNKSHIVATKYTKRQGVPAIFGLEYFEDLGRLNGDFGAKEIIKKHQGKVVSVSAKGKEIDVDTLAAYDNLINAYFKSLSE